MHVENELEKRRKQRLREPEEVCEIPDDLIQSVNTDSMGCSCMKFSNNKNYIACACCGNKCVVKMYIKIYYYRFELNTFKCIMKISAHYNYIYTIYWSYFDDFLITASADCINIYFFRFCWNICN